VCPYCDFAVATGAPDHERYLEAILAELAARAPRFSGDLVSIYLGGGTPSLWEPECIARAIAAIRSTFGDGQLREVTLEANPIDCARYNCARWKSAGVTRLSIGVQSLATDELVVLGRDHRFGDGPQAVDNALAEGGLAISCDAIVGTPIAGRAPDFATIDALAALPIDHLSVYELTIEDRTAFGARVREGRMVPLDEDVLAELYTGVHDRLLRGGFEHYEISSYARPGRRAVHNPRRVADYYAGVAPEVVASSPAELASERAWLGMRTSDGVPEAALTAEIVGWLVGEGLASRSAGRICPTLRGFLLANRIAARIAEAL
jgi:oxygen-independent coproporphyrinogen-3 oxidase